MLLLVVVLLVVLMVVHAARPAWLLFPLHLLMFFVMAMVCHGELAASRPSAEDVTTFYVWLSVGGVLGGLFTTLLAPVIFETVIEYPLAIATACLLRPPSPSQPSAPR